MAARLAPLRPEMAAIAARSAFSEGTRPPQRSGLCGAIEQVEDDRVPNRNRLSEAAESGHWAKPDCRTSPPGRARCAHTRCGAAVRAQLEKLPEDLSALGGFVVGL